MSRQRGDGWMWRVMARVAVTMAVLGLSGLASAQPNAGDAAATVLIAPQSRNVTIAPWPGPRPIAPMVRVERADVHVEIRGTMAATTLAFTLRNDGSMPQETQLLVPVPAGAAVRSFQLDSVGNEPTATLLPIDEARAIYQSIVSKAKDPGLLEFVGTSLIRSSVFPVPANGTNTVRLTYEEILVPDGDRLDYTLLRSDALGAEGGTWRGGERLVTQWSYSMDIQADRSIASVTSPSHEIEVSRPETVTNQRVVVKSRPGAATTPGPFRLSVLLAKGEQPTGTLVLYPDATVSPEGGGYFMLMVSPPPGKKEEGQRTITREVTLVIDRSGSMRGQKMEQAKAAALQVVEGLREGERFNIIDYSDSVQSLFPEPQARNSETIKQARAYITAIEANGGTNIHDAMIEALRPKVMAELPLVLFLTDGLATVGQTSESHIRVAIEKANEAGAAEGRAKRRIFTFGVGVDVNVPLLSNIATASRAASTFVLPDENVEVKVSQVARRLEGPVLASPTCQATAGGRGPRLWYIQSPIRDVQPTELPDVFEGEPLVLLGVYTSPTGPQQLTITGKSSRGDVEIDVPFDASKARVQNAYVSRLWARSKIGWLIDQVRKNGETGVSAGDAKNKELVDEIVRLSTKFGILSEYTAFLAIEPGAVADAAGFANRYLGLHQDSLALRDATAENLQRTVEARSGAAAIAPQINLQEALAAGQGGGQSQLASMRSQTYLNEKMERVDITGVQFIGDLALFARPGRWVDSNLLTNDQDRLDPEATIEFGSDAYMTLASELGAQQRAGVLALGQDVYLLHNAKRVLVKGLVIDEEKPAVEPK